VSGGGIRAAAWTALVLETLEQRLPDLRRHVRVVAGASGGMVGAGAWVARMVAPPHGAAFDGVRRDALSAVTRALLVPGQDRGTALESAFAANYPPLRLTFDDLAPFEAAGDVPSLVYTPMVVHDGRRLVVANLDTAAITRARTGPGEPSLTGVSLFDLFPGAAPHVTLARAARMSASFPFVSPFAEVPTAPPVQLVDAGAYDNYGVAVGAGWIHENRGFLARCTSGVALLQIVDALTDARTVLAPPGGGAVARLTSPLQALLSGWSSSMTFRNDEQIEALAGALPQGHLEAFTLAFTGEAALNWVLTREEVTSLRAAAAARDVQAEIERFTRWMHPATPPIAEGSAP
jgi:hypothetical protein